MTGMSNVGVYDFARAAKRLGDSVDAARAEVLRTLLEFLGSATLSQGFRRSGTQEDKLS